MALENNFYDEIKNKELVWSEHLKKDLLNIYYIKLDLKEFYKQKLGTLINEYTLTRNKLLEQIIKELNCIVNKIEELELEYKNGNTPDLKSLIPLFLVNKLNNTSKAVGKDNIIISKDDIRNQITAAFQKHYTNSNLKKHDDTLYDEFDEDVKLLRR